jgi:hypothetical protein
MNSAIQGIMKRFIVTYKISTTEGLTETMLVSSKDIFSAVAEAQELLHQDCVITTITDHD